MELKFRRFKARRELAIFLRQSDIYELTGLRGRAAHSVMANDGWQLGVWTAPGSSVRFKGYRRILSLEVLQ